MFRRKCCNFAPRNTRVLDNLAKKTRIMQNKNVSVSFMICGILFCVCLICSNMLVVKSFEFGPLNFTGALFVFPISYILNDCISEVWGFKKARLIIWMGFLMNFLVALFGALVDAIPGAPYFEMNDAFHAIFGLVPRVAAASFLAFLVGSFLNAYVMSKMKVASQGRHFSARAVLSSLAGELSDSVIFFPLALGGIVPWDKMGLMVITQAVLKTAYEIVILPLTIKIVNWLKKREGTDVYDHDISYNVFRVREI